MKWFKCMLLVVVALSTMASYAVAGCDADANAVDVTISGQARYRMEIDGRSFNADVNNDWMQYMRTRIGFDAKASANAGVFVQFQDSRILGLNPGTQAFNNNTGNYETGIHQAYLWYKPCDKGWAKVGRMSVGLHNERLIGKVGWSNIGRTEEGLMFGRKLSDDVNLTGAVWQLQENNADDEDTGDRYMDPMFYLLNFNFAEQGFDLFAYLWKNEAAADYKLFTFGAYSHRTFADSWFYDSMFALQTGSDDDVDYSGMLINAEIGDKFDSGLAVSGLFDYTTGDDANTTDEVETFNNLLYTGHKWNGYMDYFVGGLSTGLMDIALRVKYPLDNGWSIKGDVHSFSTAEDMDNGKSALGTEFDFAVKKTDGPFSIEGGLGIFSPSDDWIEGGDTGSWGYLQSMVNF